MQLIFLFFNSILLGFFFFFWDLTSSKLIATLKKSPENLSLLAHFLFLTISLVFFYFSKDVITQTSKKDIGTLKTAQKMFWAAFESILPVLY